MTATLHELRPAPGAEARKLILVGVDGSAESRKAAEFAGQLAKATGSALSIAHVLPVIADTTPYANRLVQPWQADRTQYAQLMLHDLSHGLPGFTGPVDTVLLEGSPAHRLADEAHRPGVWLVVVGHRGRGALQRVLVGSVADRLTQICPRPVLVVR